MGCCSTTLVNSSKIEPHNSHNWNYSNLSDWGRIYPSANGLNQSPIDIITSIAEFDETLKSNEFNFSFDLNCFIEIKNNGHTFMVSGVSDSSNVVGGPLPAQYKFVQFHMHWGLNEATGSEHLVDGSSFAGEIHFVYWNCEKYKSFEEAAKSSTHDGLAVFGVFVILGAENNEFNKLVSVMDNVKLANHTTFVSRPLEIIKLFPDNLNKYWTYLGSLTTPPCTECALWTVFCDPIQMSIKQLYRIKHLYNCSELSHCTESKRIRKNHRLPCELNGRRVLKSFQ
ncbi:unnamed protein product [Brachionus calyciflorus]|uniref:Carbonic anhydrase n=1 Tax=Brachionus calyciflorus TaxID=104777 RepID=A0A814G7J2_9BILA|nr:unnamed protein product [Brachionus calyciflorus]